MASNGYYRTFAILFATLSGLVAQTEEQVAPGVPPEGPRDFSSFATLLMKSPFVMPSEGGDQSPIAQRYQLTGAAKIGDKPHVFILDVVNQTRLMVSPDQPDGEVSLISFDGETEADRTRATIRVGDETGVISFAKSQLAAPPPSAEAPAESVPANVITTQTAPTAKPPVEATAEGGTRPPSAAELQQLGEAAQAGTLQAVPPRRILRKTNPVPLPANGQPVPTQ